MIYFKEIYPLLIFSVVALTSYLSKSGTYLGKLADFDGHKKTDYYFAKPIKYEGKSAFLLVRCVNKMTDGAKFHTVAYLTDVITQEEIDNFDYERALKRANDPNFRKQQKAKEKGNKKIKANTLNAGYATFDVGPLRAKDLYTYIIANSQQQFNKFNEILSEKDFIQRIENAKSDITIIKLNYTQNSTKIGTFI